MGVPIPIERLGDVANLLTYLLIRWGVIKLTVSHITDCSRLIFNSFKPNVIKPEFFQPDLFKVVQVPIMIFKYRNKLI